MILKFLRLLKIFTVATKYGLDEIAMSGFDAPRTARFVSGMFFWRKRITTPRAIRLRLALEERPVLVRPAAVHEFAADVVRLRDDVERTAKRIARLEQRLAASAVTTRPSADLTSDRR